MTRVGEVDGLRFGGSVGEGNGLSAVEGGQRMGREDGDGIFLRGPAVPMGTVGVTKAKTSKISRKKTERCRVAGARFVVICPPLYQSFIESRLAPPKWHPDHTVLFGRTVIIAPPAA
ncbi:hypothetical protein [Amycolatopsis sp. EV170708-02-1]|uniref:hypothetical protein n=1 Tax=Amycolatopsis sp. EV170708-02-1 TaxID=2919322 RepID=UPI001F0C62A4|nr:hypothetical protein [Amycolatopsis sp. EV170708-02-1]UMP01103.1 hypothetical protein MJQ72_32340 [Amycolatopsis sp. EV170708-02-1]